MIDSKEYINMLVKNSFSIKHDENKDICALLRAIPDVESYSIFLEEYLCFKIAMAYRILMLTDFRESNDFIHTGEELINKLIDAAYSVIEKNVIRLPNFFSDNDIIKDQFYDRFVMYEEGKGLYFHFLFRSKLPDSMADKIDKDELFNVIYGAYHLVEDEIGRTAKNKTAQKDVTIIRQVFPNIGKTLEFTIAIIIFYVIPIMLIKWITARTPASGRIIYGVGYSVFISVYLLRCIKKIYGETEGADHTYDWIQECFFMFFLIAVGVFIMK